MSISLLVLVCNVCLLFAFIDLTVSINANSNVQLFVHPNYGFSTENIEVRCQITTPSIYDNIYLSVKTDNVKPSGILLMVDNTINQCRINKEKYLQINVCSSTLILIYVNHTVLNDTLRTIDYECRQGEDNVVSSYRILKEQPAKYYDAKSSNSSSLTCTFPLLVFILLITRLTIADEVRWLLTEQKIR